MKKLLTYIAFLPALAFGQAGGTDCSGMEPICTDAGVQFTANSGVAEASTTDPGNNYDCLITQPNPSWYYFEISNAGTIDMSLSAPSDIDFIIWGPYPNLSAAQAECGDLGTPTTEVVDCSFSATANETPSIPNAQVGEVYIMLITNYANVVQDITLTQTGGTGATDCNIVTNPPCAMVSFDPQVGGCDFLTNTYDISGTVDYTDPPTTGSLIVEDCNGNQTIVDTAPFAAGPQAFSLTGLAADGAPCDVEVYFTADPACSQTFNYVAPVCVNNCPTYDLQSTSPTEACGNQIYYMEIENSGCDGFVQFDVVGNFGSSFANEITWDVVSNLSGNTVASGGPGVNGQPINVTVGPLDPNVEGTVFTLCVYDSFGDGFNGFGGFIQAEENGTVLTGTLSGNFGASACNIIQVGITVSSSTLTVQTPSGPVVSVMGNCNDHEVGFNLANTNFCTPIAVDLPWTIVCDNSGTLIASGTHTVTVYPQIPTSDADLVTISYNNTTCSWDVSPNNDCDSLDIGNIFDITPDPYTLNTQCADGNQNFTIDYTGFSQGPACCSTGGPAVPITYNSNNTFNDYDPADSPFGGVNNSAYLNIPANGTGGNATGFTLDVSMAGYCFNPPGIGGNTNYWVTIYVDGVIIHDQQYVAPPNNFNETFNLGDLPNGYNENSVIDIYIYPNSFSSGATNTTFSDGLGCGPDGWWDATSITADLSVTYEQTAPTPANCTFVQVSPYTCCAPVLPNGTPPANITVECVGDVPAANPALVTGVVGSCNPVVTFLSDGPVVGGNCGGTITRTYRITDDCGNIQDVTQTITIDDTQPPTATAPADITVQCNADVPAGHFTQIIDEADNCTAVPTVSYIGDVSDGNTCPETITRSWTITDLCGNQITVQQIITVNDTQAPVFAAPPANVTVQCPGDIPGNMGLGWTDNCDGSGNVGNVDGPIVGGNCGGTMTRTWTYTDNCGNTATVQQVVTIDDTTPPTASNPAGVTVECEADIPAPDVTVVTDEADNCTAVPTVIHLSDTPLVGGPCGGTVTRTYRIIDDCGNQTDVTQVFTVDDTTPPTATAPANATYQCNADVPAGHFTQITDEADNCTASPTVSYIGDVSDGNTCPETITRSWTITDNCGNQIQVDQIITVNDTQAPVFAAPPANVTVQCQADIPGNMGLGWTDNCDGSGNVGNVDVSDGNTCPEIITRSWTYTDACGNTATVTQTITVDDTTPPTASNPAPINVECITAVPLPDPTVVTDEADNCGVPVVAFVSDVSDGNSCPETITRTYSVTDACGNTINVTQSIIIDDITPPTASNPATTNLAGGPAPAPDPAVVIDEADNCGTPTVALVSNVSDGGNCPETITHTYSVTDSCGNSINVTHTIIIGDAILPTASNPAPINVECITDVPAPDPAVVTDEADNGGPPVVAFVSDVSDGNSCPEVITRTYSVTDNCLNVINVTQTITINDVTPPTGTAPADITVECIGDVPVADPLLVTDEADNCGTPTVAFVGDVSDNNTCPETITRTYTITDSCGNTLDVTQQITIDDTTAPLATAPANVNIECITDLPAPNIADVTGVSDNCTAVPVVAHVSDVSDGLSCPETITRTYSITDDCGNVTTVTQDIIINDITPPTASNPATTNLAGGPAPAPDPLVVIDEADNCGVPTVALVSNVSDGGNCPETITHTYSVTDSCGNSINVTHTIIIGDAILPTASNPAPINVECITDVPAPDPAVVTDEADNGGPPVVAFVSDVSDGNSCPEVITRTYSVTDNCLNVINVTQTITINDVTPPTGTAPADITVECIGDVPVADPLLITDEADNCGTPIVAFVGDVSDNNTCPETITRTYSITDSCGNSITVDQTIVIDDTTVPLATAPANVNIECITDLPAPNIADVTGVSDNCTAVPVVAHVSDVSDGLSCPETITRTYSITDECGNVTTVTQDIIINDITPPTASNPAQTIVPGGPAPAPDPLVVIDEADNCGVPTVAFVSQVSDGNPCPETITYTYSVTDSCGNSINVTHEVLITDPILPTGTAPADITVDCITAVPAADPALIVDEADNNGLPTVTHLSDVSDGNSCPEVITRTYRITDPCGNFIDVVQLITVHDLTPPTGTAPANVTVECIGDVPVADPLLITDEADNCGTPTVAFVGDVSDNNTCPETITRTYSITDSCGNSITVDQTIIVDDTTAPLATAPANVNIECITDLPAPNIADVTGVSDNCDPNPTVVHVSDVSDGLSCPETITRTYDVTDACGNVTTVTHDIIINDITPPTASNPAQTVIPGGPAPAPDPLVVIDEADNCGVPTVAFVSQVSDGNPCPETITYTYSVTDSCGNSINVTHEVLITDPINPTGTAPADITVECGAIPAADPALIVDEADNNGVPTVAFVSDVSDGQTCPETIIRTYSITDVCGNQILVTQTITVDDTTLPTASNPAPINVECIGDVPAADPAVVTDEADNCSVPVVAFVGDVSDNNTCPETITRTYSVTDDCGNTINVTQQIIVNDITPPTASNPAPINVECIADVPGSDPAVVIDEADNCTANPAVVFVSDVSDGNTCPETITRTYSVTDDCGNSINVTQTITVNDITNPTASNPADINVSCPSDVPAPDPAVVTDEADNCSVPTVAFVSDVSDGNVCNGETITRTYSVTDACGNSINVTQLINIGAQTPTVDAGVDQSVCEGTMVTLNATSSAGANVSWDQGVIDGVAFNSPTGTTTYTVTAEICGGTCVATDQVDITVNPTPVVSFIGDELLGCEPHTVNFTNTSSEQGDCVWDLGDGTIVTGCGPISHTYLTSGDYDVSLTVTSPAGCTASDTYSNYISVVPLPVAQFTYFPSDPIITDTEVDFTNSSINAATYAWDFGDNFTSQDEHPTHAFPEVAGDYTVTLWAYNAAGCADSTQAVITVKDELLFYVPNVMTPDGNSFNEVFLPIFAGGLDVYDYHLTIFNRWGEVIFESYNVLVGWDGTYGEGGLVQDGVYIWQLEFGETMSDKKHKHRGHVTVLK